RRRPLADVRSTAGGAGRGLARAQDHGRRHAPHGRPPPDPLDASGRANRQDRGDKAGFGGASDPRRVRRISMAANINRVVLVGNLTKDPELRHTPSGTAVCSLRLRATTPPKGSGAGGGAQKPPYCAITVWGNQGESCAQYLSKGRPVAVDGRLEWREWDAQDGTKR